MLINSSNTAKERKETEFFHWMEKMASCQITKKKKNHSGGRESLIPSWNIHLEIPYLKICILKTETREENVAYCLSERASYRF